MLNREVPVDLEVFNTGLRSPYRLAIVRSRLKVAFHIRWRSRLSESCLSYCEIAVAVGARTEFKDMKSRGTKDDFDFMKS